MRGQVASALVVVALVVGVVIGYAANSPGPGTITKSFAFTTTVYRGSESEVCTVVAYHVWSVEAISNSTTVGGTSTQSYPVTTFQTSSYPSYTSVTYSGTMTGALAYWNITSCG